MAAAPEPAIAAPARLVHAGATHGRRRSGVPACGPAAHSVTSELRCAVGQAGPCRRGRQRRTRLRADGGAMKREGGSYGRESRSGDATGSARMRLLRASGATCSFRRGRSSTMVARRRAGRRWLGAVTRTSGDGFGSARGRIGDGGGLARCGARSGGRDRVAVVRPAFMVCDEFKNKSRDAALVIPTEVSILSCTDQSDLIFRLLDSILLAVD